MDRKQNPVTPSITARTGSHPESLTNLLSLPDEPLCKIFHNLGASKTNLNLLGPQQAFPLALTNTRLFNIFRSMLRTIQPDIDPRNSSTVAPKRLLALARLAGEHLRKLHVPAGSSHILSELSEICPNLKFLRIVQGDDEELPSVLSDIVDMSLHKLSINGVSQRTLSLITSVPQDLTLTRMDQHCFEDLKRLLVHPPKRLCLLFNFSTEIENIPELIPMIETIVEVCPRVEALTVRVQPDNDWNVGDFESEARRCVERIRNNAKNSVCKNILLTGKSTLPILDKVHPDAYVSLTSNNIEFGDSGDGLFVRSMIVQDEFLGLDLSRLHTVQVTGDSYDPRWKKLLRRLILKYALVRNLRQAEDLCLSAIVLNVGDLFCDEEDRFSGNWEWVSKVCQLELPAPQTSISSGKLTKYFSILIEILDEFCGSAVWIDNFKPVDLQDRIGILLIEAGKMLLNSVQEYEKRGGDAQCVKDVVIGILGEHVQA